MRPNTWIRRTSEMSHAMNKTTKPDGAANGVGPGEIVRGSPAGEFVKWSLAGIMVRAQWDTNGWWNILHDADGTRQHHAISLCRCRSEDGIVLYQLILAGLRVVVGRTNQAPNDGHQPTR